MTAATDMIAAERERQIEELGYTQDHDAEHDEADLAFAAVCYAAPVPVYLFRYVEQPAQPGQGQGGSVQWVEPWPLGWARPERAADRDGRIDELVKAGALIAAELDRMLAEEDSSN